jgi:hypothetical protein
MTTLTARRWSQVERRVAAELPQLLPGPHEDVLGHLVGFVAAEHPPCQAVNAPDVRAVDPLEGGRIPARRQGDVFVHPAARWGFAGYRHYRQSRHNPPAYNGLDGLRLLKG